MQNIKVGGVKAAAIAGVPIVPVILEYVEVPELCSKETDLYRKCIVRMSLTINMISDIMNEWVKNIEQKG